MTPQEVIDDVRELVSDTTTVYRHSDAQLLIFVNQAVKRIALLRPDLFAVYADITCVTDAVTQTAPSDSLRLMEVEAVVGGNAIYESDRPTMDMQNPGWRQEASAAGICWMRQARLPNGFYIYPPAPAAQELTLLYAKTPSTDYSLGDTITELGETYKTSMTDCVVFLSQSIDDEHVASGRAKLFFEVFTQSLGIDSKGRQVTDTENAGLQPNSGEK